VVFINAAGRAVTKPQIQVICDSLQAIAPTWSILWILEADPKFSTEHAEISDLAWVSWRHWSGQGIYALRLLIRCWMRPYIADVRWRGRSGIVKLLSRPCFGGLSSGHSKIRAPCMLVVGVHARAGELAGQLTDINLLLGKSKRPSRTIVGVVWNHDLLVLRGWRRCLSNGPRTGRRCKASAKPGR
jgi:hypothetical protein